MTETVYGRVEPLWRGETCVILGGGPSLTQDDVDRCRDARVKVIAIKHTLLIADFAHCLYSSGADASRWLNQVGPSLGWFKGLRFTLDPRASKWATVLKNGGESGLSTDPTALRTGRNSGTAAINLSFLLGATRILLLGFDFQFSGTKQHWWGNHQHGIPPPVEDFRRLLPTMVAPLQDRGITLVNCSRETAIECIPQMDLEDALMQVAA